MKITIENTSRIVEVRTPGGGSIEARVWEGTTESGIPVHCLIAEIAVHKDYDRSQFERELRETRPPSSAAVQVFPLRLVL